MERKSSCCSGRSYCSTPKKEPMVTPKKESELKPQTISTVKAGAEEKAAIKREPVANHKQIIKAHKKGHQDVQSIISHNPLSTNPIQLSNKHSRPRSSTLIIIIITTEAPILELYMHDILGGNSPTARPITGLLGNIYSGQVPFARPLGFLPPQNGVAIPNSNGAVPTINPNGVPLGTGLIGTSFTNPNNNNIRTINTAQLGPDVLGLGFGTITVIDDYLTSAPELGSQQLGRAQGVYVASSADGSSQMMAFTAMMEGGEFGDFFGIFKIGGGVSRLSVTGGTGKFKNACGFAEVRSQIPAGQHVLDGVETLLRISVHLTY